MITLEQFEKAIKTMQEFENTMHQIDKLTHRENVGFNDFEFPLLNQYVKLLELHFSKPEEQWIDHWLYESSKWVGLNGKEYDITEIKDLYYWLCEEYDNVKLWSNERK